MRDDGSSRGQQVACQSRPYLLAILVAFVVLAGCYNVTIPLYESPDELEHTAFVVWLADKGTLPVVETTRPGPWLQEGTQPPLYYWIAACLFGGVPHDPADRLAVRNLHANLGNPLRPGNKNAVLHDQQRESWPYREGVLFVHLVRLLSTLMALGTLAAVYRVGRILFPEQPGVGLVMTGLVAFTPQFLFISASVNNDNLVILIASWAVVMLMGWVCRGRLPGWLPLGGLGILLGTAALAKSGGWLLWLLAAAVLASLAWRGADNRRPMTWFVTAGLVVFGVALALSGWWFARNLRLYGELAALGPHLSIIGRRARLPTLPEAWEEFRGFRYSYWLLFGWFNILAPDAYYWVMDVLTLLGGVGSVLVVRRMRRQGPATRCAALLTLVVWLGLVAAGLFRWTLLTPASQGRLLYPALTSVAFVLAVGWMEWVPARLRRGIGTLALTLWVAWGALCPFLILRPAYALPKRLESIDQLVPPPTDLKVRFGDCCELVGYLWPQGGAGDRRLMPGASEVSYRAAPRLDRPIRAGDWVPLTLVWRALEPTDEDYLLFIHAITADGQRVGQVDTHPGNGAYPTHLWRAGELIVDTVQVPISSGSEGPILVRFDVGLYSLSPWQMLPAFDEHGRSLERVTAGEAGLVPMEWPVPLELPNQTLFADSIRLTGVDVAQTAARPGEVVTVTLHWQALVRITEDFTGFVHLMDATGKDVAQDDHLPLSGLYPTRVWFAGAVVIDPYRLELPQNLPPGRYDLVAGLYRARSGLRLPATEQRVDQDGVLRTIGRWKDDLVRLGTIVVGEGE